MDLAKKFGVPTPSPNSKLIGEILVQDSFEAKADTLSSSFGRGRFPLHTDTAFWPVPARYLVFRATGDLRRPTTVLPINRIPGIFGNKMLEIISRSIWLLKTPSMATYCSMRFPVGEADVWRYDRQCMTPANSAAKEIAEAVDCLSAGLADEIQWRADNAVVIANWVVLHGRGPEPANEAVRNLERIYVR